MEQSALLVRCIYDAHAARHTLLHGARRATQPATHLHSQENRTSPSHYCPEIAEADHVEKNSFTKFTAFHRFPSFLSSSVKNVSEKTLKLWEIKVATWHTSVVSQRQTVGIAAAL